MVGPARDWSTASVDSPVLAAALLLSFKHPTHDGCVMQILEIHLLPSHSGDIPGSR